MKHVIGNIFESGADIILHQVNCQGVMGSGIAKQVRELFPEVFHQYKLLCDCDKKVKDCCGLSHSTLLGSIQVVYAKEREIDGSREDPQEIVNLFAQDNYGYDGRCYTDYDALRRCLEKVNKQFAGKRVAIPYLMACHRGGGDWSIVSKMIDETLVDCDVTLYEYRGG